MGNPWTDDYLDDDGQGQSPPNLKDLPEPARKHLRKVERERDEFKKQLEELQAEKRKSSLADVVKAKGYPPIVANFIPSTVDATGVDKWLEDNGSVFAKEAPPVQNAPTPPEEDPDAGLDPTWIAQMAAIAGATQNAIPPANQGNLMALIQNAKTAEDLDKIIASQGGLKS